MTDAAPPGARAEVAAAYAAYTTLVSLFPTKQAMFDAQLAESMSQIPGSAGNSQSIASGKSWGETVAAQILAWRATDGFSQTMTYPGSTGPGHWRHAPFGGSPAGALSTSVTAPFALTDLASFDPGPPYGQEDRVAAMATAAYAADVSEVKARGGAISSVRTAAQADLGLLIHISDVPDINAIVRGLVPSVATLVDNARTFALINIAASDAAVVCFKAKYKYGFWRPVQAIRYADEDGNAATVADPMWTPLGTVPSHPEYVSGHSTVSGAMLAMAAAILGDEKTFTLTTSNPGAPSITPEFTRFSALSDAIGESRIDMGFHFRTACILGQRMGSAVAAQIVNNALLPLRGAGPISLAVRGHAGAGNDVLIAGINLTAGTRQVLVRAIGPGLGSFHVEDAVADPKVTVFDAAGRTVAENDNWCGGGPTETASLMTAMSRCAAFPIAAGSRDAALIVTLPPGSYTVHASGVAGSAGTGLIEILELP